MTSVRVRTRLYKPTSGRRAPPGCSRARCAYRPPPARRGRSSRDIEAVKPRETARGEVGGDRLRRGGVDDPADSNEGDARAPGAAVRPHDKGAACGRAPPQSLHYGPVRRAGLSQPVLQAVRRRQALKAARAVEDPGRSARLPFVLSALGVRADGSPTGGGGGCARARTAHPPRVDPQLSYVV